MSLRIRRPVMAAVALAFSMPVITTLHAQAAAATVIPAAKEQITAAVLALPEAMRDDAGVMGYKTVGKLEQLRPSKNGMLCLADDPADKGFHVSCYHDGMDPFMARGREQIGRAHV